MLHRLYQDIYRPGPAISFLIHSYIYSTTKHKILKISHHNLLCSLDPPNQGWLFRVVGPKLINDTEYNWLHISKMFLDRYGVDWKEGDWIEGDLWQGEIRVIFM